MGKRKPGGIAERAASMFDLNAETAAGVVRVTVTGTARAHIENHRGLLGYAEEEISVNGGRVIIVIRGEGLELAAMSDMELVVTGQIAAVEYHS